MDEIEKDEHGDTMPKSRRQRKQRDESVTCIASLPMQCMLNPWVTSQRAGQCIVANVHSVCIVFAWKSHSLLVGRVLCAMVYPRSYQRNTARSRGRCKRLMEMLEVVDDRWSIQWVFKPSRTSLVLETAIALCDNECRLANIYHASHSLASQVKLDLQSQL